MLCLVSLPQPGGSGYFWGAASWGAQMAAQRLLLCPAEPNGMESWAVPASIAAWLGRVPGPRGCSRAVPRGLCVAVHFLSDGRRAGEFSSLFL